MASNLSNADAESETDVVRVEAAVEQVLNGVRVGLDGATAKTLDTLQLLATIEGPVSISELASDSDAAKSTVARHVTQLAEAGAVRTSAEGKTKQVELTLTGRLLLRTHAESM
ncbi:helix-turn-helix domain-containing protein [Halorussus caseinilyticus]|uniref:Helix-turn-helix domain-containing protein n=1 Tax=Halorussus caseinilyticus TaxID=3034025 RepID=A0ABD5WJ79_9EURY|nr:helix-turn-helix domain-containing protein [Halorussus sp. DT72]